MTPPLPILPGAVAVASLAALAVLSGLAAKVGGQCHLRHGTGAVLGRARHGRHRRSRRAFWGDCLEFGRRWARQTTERTRSAHHDRFSGASKFGVVVRLLDHDSVRKASLGLEIPVIILTGDISTHALQAIADQKCRQLNKPVQLAELTQALPPRASRPAMRGEPTARAAAAAGAAAVIFVVDDDHQIREALRELLEADGRIVEDFGDCDSFPKAYRAGQGIVCW
jgi:CheY-like chemotaxis protein